MSDKEVASLKGALFLANQSNLKSYQKLLVAWKKASPPKKTCKVNLEYCKCLP